jgi:hypothetical protein
MIEFGVSPPPEVGTKWKSYRGTRWIYDGPAVNEDGSPKLFEGDNETPKQKVTCIADSSSYQVGDSIDVLPNWFGGSAVPDPDPV